MPFWGGLHFPGFCVSVSFPQELNYLMFHFLRLILVIAPVTEKERKDKREGGRGGGGKEGIKEERSQAGVG